MVYREVNISVIQLLVLRMFFSLPFFLGMLYWQWRRYAQNQSSSGTPKAPFYSSRLLLYTMLIGCLGYYVSSLLDFWGLKFISASLERVILFSYPTLVVIFGALLFGNPVRPHQVGALVVSYLGIGVAFWGDLTHNTGTDVWRGAALILGCAVTFSFYVLLSGRWISSIGVGLFTAVAMLAATLAIFVHYFLAEGHLSSLLGFSTRVYFLMGIMAVFTTVVPSFFVSLGIQRIGSSNVAIISSIGPIITIAQAWYFLGEPFGWPQAIGTALVVAGVLWVSRKVTTKEPNLGTTSKSIPTA